MSTPSFDSELNAIKSIYDALKPFAIHERDRLLRMVQERLARERNPAGPLPKVELPDPVQPIPFAAEARKR
jgi:hypothetical protein